MFSFTHSVGDYDATFTVEDFTPGERETRDEPGTGATCTLGNSVTLTDDDSVDTVVSLEDAVRIYQAAKRLRDSDDALAELVDAGVEAYTDHLDAMWSDRC